MDPVQALAILSLGAFVTVLVTALFYVFTVRPRLLEPVSLSSVGMLDDALREELLEQRAAVRALNDALQRHTAHLEAAAQASGSDALGGLQSVLASQTDAVETITRLLDAQAARLDRVDSRLEEQTLRLDRLETTLARTVSAPRPSSALDPLAAQIQEQANRLVTIGSRLDEWVASRSREDQQLAEHARILAELDRELAAQAQVVQQLDARVTEHTTMLITAASERRQQGGMLERVAQQIGQLLSMVTQLGAVPLRPGQDRLTDIRGIGPVYAGKLYEAGIQTFEQLAQMTPDDLYRLIDQPQWRMRSIDAESWIEQAAQRAARQQQSESTS